MATAKDTVNIHGKAYETVASRVQRFRETLGRVDKPTGHRLVTEIIERTDDVVVMKATISDDEGNVLATGHAEENRTSSQINRTSALENCETSAIGRALAAFGMAGTEYASADEVANAIQQRPAIASKPTDHAANVAEVFGEAATPIQRRQINAMLIALEVPEDERAAYIEQEFKVNPKTMSKSDAVSILEGLK